MTSAPPESATAASTAGADRTGPTGALWTPDVRYRSDRGVPKATLRHFGSHALVIIPVARYSTRQRCCSSAIFIGRHLASPHTTTPHLLAHRHRLYGRSLASWDPQPTGTASRPTCDHFAATERCHGSRSVIAHSTDVLICSCGCFFELFKAHSCLG